VIWWLSIVAVAQAACEDLSVCVSLTSAPSVLESWDPAAGTLCVTPRPGDALSTDLVLQGTGTEAVAVCGGPSMAQLPRLVAADLERLDVVSAHLDHTQDAPAVEADGVSEVTLAQVRAQPAQGPALAVVDAVRVEVLGGLFCDRGTVAVTSQDVEELDFHGVVFAGSTIRHVLATDVAEVGFHNVTADGDARLVSFFEDPVFVRRFDITDSLFLTDESLWGGTSFEPTVTASVSLGDQIAQAIALPIRTRQDLVQGTGCTLEDYCIQDVLRDAGTLPSGPVEAEPDRTATDVGATGGPHSMLADADDDLVREDIDCDDTDPTVFPVRPSVFGAPLDPMEPQPSARDVDCDGVVRCYADADCDGYSIDVLVEAPACLTTPAPTCSGGQALLAIIGPDCDDDDPDLRPDAEETPGDPVDENCDGVYACWLDEDGDGLTVLVERDSPAGCLPTSLGDDCDDTDADRGGAEVIGNDLDEDCDGVVSCFADLDGDGDPGTTPVSADLLDGATCESRPGADCDDTEPSISSTAEEVAGNDIDEDCDGAWLCGVDADGDGAFGEVFVSSNEACETGPADCDDDNASVRPGAEDAVGDGIDQDCSGKDAGVTVVCGCSNGARQTGWLVLATAFFVRRRRRQLAIAT
jgi:hypothetical protein